MYFRKSELLLNYMGRFIPFWFIGFVLISCSDSSKSNLEIDPAVEAEVLENTSGIILSGESSPLENVLIYSNAVYLEFYEDGVKKGSTFEDPGQDIFKSWYYFQEDTLILEGAFGLFGGTGFFAKVYEDTALIYYLVASDDFPSYSYYEDGPIQDRLEVLCTNAHLKVSTIPTAEQDDVTIYGVTEFTSADYYQGARIENLTRVSVRMKIYFKANRVNWFQNLR